MWTRPKSVHYVGNVVKLKLNLLWVIKIERHCRFLYCIQVTYIPCIFILPSSLNTKTTWVVRTSPASRHSFLAWLRDCSPRNCTPSWRCILRLSWKDKKAIWKINDNKVNNYYEWYLSLTNMTQSNESLAKNV